MEENEIVVSKSFHRITLKKRRKRSLTGLSMMDLAFDDCGVGAGLDFKSGNSVVVDVVALKVAHAVIKGEDADVAAMVYVIPAHDRIRVIFHPNARQRVPTDLVVLVSTLGKPKNRSCPSKIKSFFESNLENLTKTVQNSACRGVGW